MESDGDVVLVGLAPRFREDLCRCQCLLIHHTARGPGSDTLQRFSDPLSNLCSALSCMFLCLAFSLPSSHSLFLSQSVKAISCASGKMDGRVSMHTLHWAFFPFSAV